MRALSTNRPYHDYMRRAAGFSDPTPGTSLYRYYLERVWNPDLPTALWIMLNPSTADHEDDDATIRKVVAFSKVFGMGSIRVLNLFAYRATEPEDLVWEGTHGVDIVGPENEELLADDLASMNETPGVVICAWGASIVPGKDERVEFVREHSFGAWCLGKTKDGSPKHPLYLPAATALDRW